MKRLYQEMLLVSMGFFVVATPAFAEEIAQVQKSNLIRNKPILVEVYQKANPLNFFNQSQDDNRIIRNNNDTLGVRSLENIYSTENLFSPIVPDIPGDNIETTNLDLAKQQALDDINRNVTLKLRVPSGTQEGFWFNVNLNDLGKKRIK